MKPLLKKVPTLIVIGVTGFVVFMILFSEGDSGPPKGGARPPSTSKVDLSVVENTPRNPFLMELPAEPTANPGVKGEAETTKGAANGTSKEKPDDLPPLPAEEDRILESMKLVGTYVDSRAQLAVINNKIYARGEQLRGADGASLPYVVIEVRKDRALVRRGRRDFIIAFSDVPRTAEPKAIALAKPGEAKAASKAESVARFFPVEKSKKGQTTGASAAKPSENEPSDAQREMLMQLLSSMGGQGGGGGSSGGNPLSSLMGSASGSNSSALSSLINPASLSAGLDAIMGKGDNVGQSGGSSGP